MFNNFLEVRPLHSDASSRLLVCAVVESLFHHPLPCTYALQVLEQMNSQHMFGENAHGTMLLMLISNY
jgi:hypothetical protein